MQKQDLDGPRALDVEIWDYISEYSWQVLCGIGMDKNPTFCSLFSGLLLFGKKKKIQNQEIAQCL